MPDEYCAIGYWTTSGRRVITRRSMSKEQAHALARRYSPHSRFAEPVHVTAVLRITKLHYPSSLPPGYASWCEEMYCRMIRSGRSYEEFTKHNPHFELPGR